MRSMPPRPHNLSPPTRRSRAVSERRGDLRLGLIWALSPTAFAALAAPTGGPDEFATMLYFSLTTLTTTGYGDIVPVDPFARSSANLESVIGQFYLAITIARLVTLEVEDRRR
jgi:Ion channel